MLLGEVFQSIAAWKKLAGVNMKPKVAYKILKYTKLVSAEFDIAEQQRVALIHEITETKPGEDARIEQDTPELQEYVKKFNEVMLTETQLPPIGIDFCDVIDAVDEKDETLTVQDLALLEPFFGGYEEPEGEFRNRDGTPKTELNDG